MLHNEQRLIKVEENIAKASHKHCAIENVKRKNKNNIFDKKNPIQNVQKQQYSTNS